jgi:hypothetical protein
MTVPEFIGNFTGTVSATHNIPLEALGEPRNLEILRAVFRNPEALRPGRTSAAITQDAARQVAEIAEVLRGRGHDPASVAHFLDRIVLFLFAEDAGLLPEKVFTRILDKSGGDTKRLSTFLAQLFETMATGGDFGLETIRHFNGSLFNDPTVIDLTPEDVKRIRTAAALDWSAVDPSIFGTLFERGLDPAKRSQLGAHFTGREDIERVVDAVVLPPLRRDWDETRTTIECLLTTGKKTPGGAGALSTNALRKARGESESILHRFLDRLQAVKILDPACGSGNFLYVSLLRLKDLEKEAILFGADNGLGTFLPTCGPWQLHGLEVNSYAHDLAQMTVWIGWLQWTRANGFGSPADPILRPLSGNIRLMDAILSGGAGVPPASTESGTTTPPANAGNAGVPPAPIDKDAGKMPAPPAFSEPDWPAVDFIVGNPPFLGDKLMRRELGDDYVDRLRALYADRIPGQSDLCCYWFEKARAHIAAGRCKRAGLLATQGIRGGANREVLKRIKDSGSIFWAESDRPWILNGANVHVSMVAFGPKGETCIGGAGILLADAGNAGVPPASSSTETAAMAAPPVFVLDGKSVPSINANLTSVADTVAARALSDQLGISFLGSCKGGPFDITEQEALALLAAAGNPNGRPNSDVIRPVANSEDVLRTRVPRWLVDSSDLPLASFALYEMPFRVVEERVKPSREQNRDKWLRENWWRPQRMRPEMRKSIAHLPRFLVTPTTAKHRVFMWLAPPMLPDHQLIVFARSDDHFFGVLHSRVHEVWALALGTQLREKASGFRYTPTTCFETFPFPESHADCDAAISAAARELNELRERWLNPPEWMRSEVLAFPASVDGPWCRSLVSPWSTTQTVHDPEEGWTPRDLYEADQSVRMAIEAAKRARGVATARMTRLVPRDTDCAVRLKDRTLTKLYNARPAWLAHCHAKLDAAVAAAYGWPADLPDDAILERLLELNRSHFPE